MSFIVNTNRLILKVENASIAPKALEFYKENRQYFEAFEPTRTDAFYTIEFQEAAAKYEYDETVKGHSLRYYIYLKNNPDKIIGSINFFRIRPMPFSSASSIMASATRSFTLPPGLKYSSFNTISAFWPSRPETLSRGVLPTRLVNESWIIIESVKCFT